MLHNTSFNLHLKLFNLMNVIIFMNWLRSLCSTCPLHSLHYGEEGDGEEGEGGTCWSFPQTPSESAKLKSPGHSYVYYS